MFFTLPYTKLLKVILMNQAQLAETLNNIAAQNKKAHDEIKAATTSLIAQVADLTDKLAGAPISDEAVAALALVQETSQAIDDLNPDAAAE
jgi:cell division protein FtsB